MFYTSRKFAYAVTMLLASIAIVLLPSVFDLEPDQTDALIEMAEYTIGFGFALITGHTVMDALSIAKGTQIPSVDQAVTNLSFAVDAEVDPAELAETLSKEFNKSAGSLRQ